MKLQTNSNLQFQIFSDYSQHYSNLEGTIQIHGTIQNTKYYSNLEYEQCKSTNQGVDQALKLYYSSH